MEGLERILGEHRLFSGLGQEFIDLAAGCAKNTRFNADEYLFHAEDPADWIYLVRHGRVALEVAAPGANILLSVNHSAMRVADLERSARTALKIAGRSGRFSSSAPAAWPSHRPNSASPTAYCFCW